MFRFISPAQEEEAKGGEPCEGLVGERGNMGGCFPCTGEPKTDDKDPPDLPTGIRGGFRGKNCLFSNVCELICCARDGSCQAVYVRDLVWLFWSRQLVLRWKLLDFVSKLGFLFRFFGFWDGAWIRVADCLLGIFDSFPFMISP